MRKLLLYILLLSGSLFAQNKGYIPSVAGAKPYYAEKVDPALRDSLFDPLFAINLTTSFGGDVVALEGWENVYIQDGLTLGVISESMVDYSNSPSSTNMEAISVPDYQGWSNTTDTVTTSPSLFPIPSKDRGYSIISSYDTVGFRLTNLTPSTYYHLSFFITSASYGTDVFRVLTLSDTVNFKDAVSSNARSYEVRALSDGEGNLDWWILPFNTALNNPALSINVMYVRSFNAAYRFTQDEIDDADPGQPTGPSLGEVDDPNLYTASTSFMTKDNIAAVYDLYGSIDVMDDSTKPEGFYVPSGIELFAWHDNNLVFDSIDYVGKYPNWIQRGYKKDYGTKQGFKYPWSTEYDLKRETVFSRIGHFDVGSYAPNGEWNAVWWRLEGAKKWGEWHVIVDSVAGTNSETMKWYESQYTDTCRFLRFTWYVGDLGNTNGNVFTNSMVTLVPDVAYYGDTINVLPPMPPVRNDDLPQRMRYGFNDLPNTDVDSMSYYGWLSRQYDNKERYRRGGAYNPYMLSPNTFSSGYIMDENKNHVLGPDGKYLHVASFYPYMRFKQLKDAGTNFILVCYQQNFRDALNWNNDQQDNWSSTIVIQDTVAAVGTIPYWKNGDSTHFPFQIDTAYDVRDKLYRALFDPTLYALKNDTFQTKPDFTRNYLNPLDSPWFKNDAVYNSPALNAPLDYVKYGSVATRDSIMTSPYTYAETGSFLFCNAAILGHGQVTNRADVQQYLQVGQHYPLNYGVVDAMSPDQEPNKGWEMASAHQKALWYAWQISVDYDGHLGLVPGKFGDHTVGVWAADTNMYISIGGDIQMEGVYLILVNRYLNAIRLERWNSLVDKTHPYNGFQMRLLPKIHFDFHHYPGSNGGQATNVADVLDYGTDYTHLVAIEDYHTEELHHLVMYMQSDEVARDRMFSCSEFNTGTNSGGPFSFRRVDIYVLRPEYKDYIKISSFGYMSPDQQDTIHERYIYRWLVGGELGGSGVDTTIDGSPSTHACSMARRMELWFYYNGVPNVELFMLRGPSYLVAKRQKYDAWTGIGSGLYMSPDQQDTLPSSIVHVKGGANNDTTLLFQTGWEGTQFQTMGWYDKAGDGVNISVRTPKMSNSAKLMMNKTLYSVVETDSVVEVTMRDFTDTTQFLLMIYTPTLNDTLSNYTINLPAGADSVWQEQPWVSTFSWPHEFVGNVSSFQEDILAQMKFFIYRKQD